VQKILVCDDDSHIRNIIDFGLAAEGFVVQVAGDGTEALTMAQADPPDLVILDVMMPGSDGLEVCQQLKQDPRTSHLPVLLLTARAGKGDRDRGLAAGADDYITKPFSPQRLVEKVQGVLGARR
jgi:two-component system phosphate regulon response regulator PhoB